MGDQKLEFEAINDSSPFALATAEVWPPPQGTTMEVVPLDLEVHFDFEAVTTPSVDFEVFACRAEIEILRDGCDVIRGSKFGDLVNEPYEVSEISEAVRSELEEGVEGEGKVDITLSKGIFGQLVAFVKRFKRRRKAEAVEHIAKISLRKYRIIPRLKDKWVIQEPVPPKLLRGRYLGARIIEGTEEKSDPLCLLTMRSLPSSVRVVLRVAIDDLRVNCCAEKLGMSLSRNKQVVISQLLKKSINKQNMGKQPHSERPSIILAQCELRCKNANH